MPFINVTARLWVSEVKPHELDRMCAGLFETLANHADSPFPETDMDGSEYVPSDEDFDKYAPNVDWAAEVEDRPKAPESRFSCDDRR